MTQPPDVAPALAVAGSAGPAPRQESASRAWTQSTMAPM